MMNLTYDVGDDGDHNSFAALCSSFVKVRGREPVDAACVFFSTVRWQVTQAFCLDPTVHDISIPHQTHVRNAEATGVTDPSDTDPHDGPHARMRRKPRAQFSPLARARNNDFTPPVKAHDLWCTFEGAEHQDNSAVLVEMRSRFRPATRQITIGHGRWIQYSKGVETLGRTVDMPLSREWSGRHKKYRLPRHPSSDVLGDGRVCLAHSLAFHLRMQHFGIHFLQCALGTP